MTLRLFGHPISQPTRAVSWLLAINNETYEYIRLNPIAGDTLKPDFLKLFPLGYVPAIEDSKFTPENPVLLAEGGAILTYLCESRGWNDWYPTSTTSQAEIARRAKINEALHWHHGALRKCTVDCFRIHMVKYMKKKNMQLKKDEVMAAAVRVPTEPEKGLHAEEHQKFLKSLKFSIEEMVANARWTAANEKDVFIVPGADKPTIADLMSYSEIDQLDYIDSIASLKKDYPLFNRWIEAMKQVPQHDECRKPLKKLAEQMKASGALGVQIDEKEQFFGVP